MFDAIANLFDTIASAPDAIVTTPDIIANLPDAIANTPDVITKMCNGIASAPDSIANTCGAIVLIGKRVYSFNENIVVENSASGGIYFGGTSGGTCTLATGITKNKIIHIDVT